MRSQNQKGFTLIEMLLSILISSVILFGVLMAVTRAWSSYNTDRNRMTSIQNYNAVLDAIGTDIREAGEFVDSLTFPAIRISLDANNNSVVTIRKALADPLILCNEISATTTPTVAVIGNNQSLSPCYRTLDTTATPNLPSELRSWRNYRCRLDNSTASPVNGDVCEGTGREQISGAILNDSGGLRWFTSTSEVTRSVTVGNGSNQTTITEYGVGLATLGVGPVLESGSIIYPLQERVYQVINGNLTLTVNRGTAQLLLPGISSFNVAAKIYSDRVQKTVNLLPSPVADRCTDDATYLCVFGSSNSWRSIAGVQVRLVPPNNQLPVTGEFFPRQNF